MDGQMTIDAPAQGAGAAPDTGGETAPDKDQPLLDALGDPPPGEDADEEEVEYEGKKWKLPKPVAKGLLLQSDYTRKTQELAQHRQTLEQAGRLMHEQQQFHQQFLDDAAGIRAIDLQLAEYEKIDWVGLIKADPQHAEILRHQRDTLRDTRQKNLQSLHERRQSLQQQQAHQFARLQEQAEAFLAREIPDYSPERASQVARYATSRGIPAAAAANVIAHMPAFGVALHKAELYDALVAKATSKPKPEAQAVPPTRISATRAQANTDPDRMSIKDWMKHRAEQLRKR